MINEIVTNTNNSISDFREDLRNILAGNHKYSYCATTDLIKIKAFKPTRYEGCYTGIYVISQSYALFLLSLMMVRQAMVGKMKLLNFM